MRQFDDPELAELFRDDPDLLDLARAAQSRDLPVPMGEHFTAYLRARLMDEAAVTLRPRGLARLRQALGSRSTLAAAFAGGAGAVMIAVALIAVTQHGNDSVNAPAAESVLAGNSHVDPATDAITIAFTEPMDQVSVVKALHIVPATSFSTSWRGNTLTITPTHGLSASTAYVVRIDNAVARSASGKAPQAPIVVAFGTQPKPATTPGAQPTPATTPNPLTPTVLATTGPLADVVGGPGGGVLVTDVSAAPSQGTAASSTSSAATSSATLGTSTAASSSSSGATATASPSASTSGSSSSTTSAAASGLVEFGPQATTVVGASASAAAVAPSGRYVAALVHDQSGGATVVVENLDGTNPRRLARADATSPIAWTSGSSVLFTSGGHLRTVDLQGVTRGAGGPSGLVVGAGQELILAPGGRWAYLGPQAGASAPAATAGSAPAARAELVDLSNGSTLELPGGSPIAAFAPDASALAWADAAASGAVDVLALSSSLPATASPAHIAVDAEGRPITALAVSAAGSRVAATIAAAEVHVSDAAGHLVASDAENATHLTFVGDDTLALVAGGHAATAALPASGGPATPTPQPPAVPADAQTLLDRLVAAQTGSGSLTGLPVAPSLDLGALTPHGATQGYVIAVQAVPNSSQVTASIRLVALPAQGSTDPVTSSDESVTLDRPDGSALQITQLTASPLSPEPIGPHVVRVSASRSAGTMTVTVAFDSDLDPATVSPAISLSTPGGLPLTSQVAFDASSRTATVTIPLSGQPAAATDRLTLSIATTLHDVDGNALAKAYSTPVTA